MEEKETAESISKLYDLKTGLIDYLDNIIIGVREGRLQGVTTLPTLRFIFVTNFAFIDGTIMPKLEEGDTITKEALFGFLIDKAVELRNKDVAESEKELGPLNVTSTSAGFALSDVTITLFNRLDNPIKVQDFFLFSDQVVGLSLSDKQ